MLRYSTKTGNWILYAGDRELRNRAVATGLDQSMPLTTRAGKAVYYTDVNYAALPFWDCADPAAREQLVKLKAEYDASLTPVHPHSYACPTDRTFMPLQDAAIAYALDRPHCIVGDEVGVGKTPTAIGIANELQADRVLVVCPANIRLQWQREVRAWSTLRKLSTYPITKSADGVSPFANWTFVSYDLLRRDPVFNALMALRFDLLIADEVQYCKEVRSLRSRRLFGDLAGTTPGLVSRADRVVGLTGTILPNRPRECYMAVRHMCWEAIDWKSEDAFRHRFHPEMTGVSKKGHFFTAAKTGRLPELRSRLRCNLLVRRTKSDPEVQRQLDVTLPEYELVYIEPNGKIKEALKAESLLQFDPNNMAGLSMEVRGYIATARRQMGEAKVPRIIEHVRMLLSTGLEKVAVFAHHKNVIEGLAKALSGGVKIWGATSPRSRQAIIDRFINDPTFQVFVGQMQACGVGTDGLQHVCRWIVLPEPSWTAGENEQVIGRIAARRGQTKDVQVQFLVVPGSLDERVLGSALKKLRVVHETLDGV